jgi:hypothetical protein
MQYDPGVAAFGGGSDHSVLHPVVLVAIIVVVLLTNLLPRKYVIIPLLLGILVIPAGQNWNVGVHLYVYRVLILVGWVRLLMSKPESGRFFPGGFITLDKVFLVWATYRFLAGSLQFMQVGAVVYQASQFVDSLGGYFLFRALIRDQKDVRRVVTAFAVVALVSAVVMVVELKTGANMMGLLGGIRLISDVRNGRIRAQGVFAHSILAGSFGAVVFPLFLWLWKRGKLTAIVGAISSTIMVFACASSTPVGAWMGTFVGICLWPMRKKMRLVRWAIVIALLGLSLVMKAPIWYLLARVDLAGGSSGWNRAFLIDTFTRHLRDWWLIGTHDNANWGWDMWDQCNQFVSEGEGGGLVAFVCFISMIVICFKKAGIARRLVQGNRREEWQFWLLGTTMFAQVMAYMGVDYFDQSKFAWYALLAIFPAATIVVQRAFVPKPTVESNPAFPVLQPAITASPHFSPLMRREDLVQGTATSGLKITDL